MRAMQAHERSMRRIVLILMMITFSHAPTLVNTTVAQEELGPCGRVFDTEIDQLYPIKGTWMFARNNACQWQDALENFHNVGGQAVLQSSHYLQRFKKSSDHFIAPNCVTETGVNCAQAALNEFSSKIRYWMQVNQFEKINHKTHYGDGIMCQTPNSLDRKFEVTKFGVNYIYYRIVLPAEGQNECDYSSGKFDVLFVVYKDQPFESQTALLSVADALNMEVYLGAPHFTPGLKDNKKTSRVDAKVEHSVKNWIARVYRDMHDRYSSYNSFRGVYQGQEMNLGENYKDVIRMYKYDAMTFHSVFPNKQYVISPYFEFNKNLPTTSTVSQTEKVFEELSKSHVDVIAPQDGRGVGKNALFWPWQKNRKVKSLDVLLAGYPKVHGDKTFSKQFVTSIENMFARLKKKQPIFAR